MYKPLAHPELENYVRPISIDERLMHVDEAKRRLGSSITWLADTMSNDFHKALVQFPNAEIILDSEGRVVMRRPWSRPQQLRDDIAGLVGAVERPTQIADLDLPAQPPIPTAQKGVVPRVPLPEGAMPMLVDVVEQTTTPYYVKLRAEAPRELWENGAGQMYLGFHLDPLYRVHWNNEVDPVEWSVTAPEGVEVSPSSGVGAHPDVPADADPREFIVDVSGPPGSVLDVQVRYFACDDALTFCIPVRQNYQVELARDTSHGWSIRTDADGNWRGGAGGMGGMGGRAGGPRGAGARPQ